MMHEMGTDDIIKQRIIAMLSTAGKPLDVVYIVNALEISYEKFVNSRILQEMEHDKTIVWDEVQAGWYLPSRAAIVLTKEVAKT